MRVFASLSRYPNLRRLLIAQVPADFADWLDFVAVIALLAFTWNADPLVFALLAVGLGLPYATVGLLAGAIVDRADLRTVLIASNLGRGAATLCLVFAPGWEALIAIVFIRSCADSFYSPARQAAIQAIVADDDLVQANGLSHAINQSSKIVAPALGGALLTVFEPQSVFLFNALVSAAAAALLWRFPSALRPPAQPAEGAALLTQIGEGIREALGVRALRLALALMAAGYFAMFFYDTLIGPLTKALAFDETTLGLTLAAVGAGGVAGSLGLGLTRGHARPFLWIAAGAALSGVSVIGLGLFETADVTPGAMLYVAIFIVLGLATSLIVVPVRTVIQRETAPEKVARVFSLSEAANTAVLLIAPFIGAMIASAFSIGAAFVAGGAIMLGLAVVALMASI